MYIRMNRHLRIKSIKIQSDFSIIELVNQDNKFLYTFNYPKFIETYLPESIKSKINLYKSISYSFSELRQYIKNGAIVEWDESSDYQEKVKLQQLILDIYLKNENLFTLTPWEFEKIIAELLLDKGFEVELTKQTRDNGYDILALKKTNDFSPIKYLVECKRYNENRKVGIEIIRSFKEVISTEQANKGIIITTSCFSRDSVKKKDETPFLLDFKDKNDILNWINNYFE